MPNFRPSPDKSSSRKLAFGLQKADSHTPRIPFLRSWESVANRKGYFLRKRALFLECLEGDLLLLYFTKFSNLNTDSC
jgi:hypothetical protein